MKGDVVIVRHAARLSDQACERIEKLVAAKFAEAGHQNVSVICLCEGMTIEIVKG